MKLQKTRDLDYKIIGIIISIAMILGTVSFTFADEVNGGPEPEIMTLKQLKNEIAKTKEKKWITKSELTEVLDKTDDAVIQEFKKEKQEKSVKAMNSVDVDEVMTTQPDGSEYGKEILDIGDGCTVVVEFEDREEETFLGSLFNVAVEPCYAAVNGKAQWKDYGRRYFTARTNALHGIGASSISLENHYVLGAGGITERTGVVNHISVNYKGGMVVGRGWTITDSVATKPGASDVNMKAKYGWSTPLIPTEVLNMSVDVTGTWNLYTTVGYVSHDKTNKQIEVRHSWKFV